MNRDESTVSMSGESRSELQLARVKRIVAVHNTLAGGAAFKQVLEMLFGIEVKTFQVDRGDSISELLPRLNELCSDTDRLYISGGLVYQEYRQTRSHLGGLEFLMHLRLTPSLSPLSSLDAVLGVFESPAELIRRSPDNCLVCSPGVQSVNPLRLFSGIQSLIARPDSGVDALQAIRPYINVTDFDEQRKSHGLFNRIGIGKLILECAADVAGEDHPLVAQFRHLLVSDLWAKKILAIKPDLLTPMPATQDALASVRARFVSLTERPVAIQIDDEHIHGWSAGLYMAVTGESCDSERFRAAGITKSPCDRLLCIDNREDASKLFQDNHSAFESTVEAWSNAEHQAFLDDTANTRAKTKADELKKQLSQAATERQRSEQLLANNRTQLADRQKKCVAQMDQFKALAWQVVDDDNPTAIELLKSVPQLRSFIPQLKETIEAYEKAANATELAEQTFTKKVAEHEALKVELKNADDAFKAISQRLADAKKTKSDLEKSVFETYPCNLVFLDLRLKPEDGSCPVENASGVRLLREIKEAYPYLPVIMMTASQQALSSEYARSAGASGYWIKGLHSGEYFTNLLETVIDQAELRDCWIKLRMLQAKREWMCVEYDRNSYKVLPRVLSRNDDYIDPDEVSSDRTTIEVRLEEVLMLLFQFGTGTTPEVLSRRDYPFDQIVLILAQIQELRFAGFEGVDEWKKAYATLGADSLAKVEQELRKWRNAISHRGTMFESRAEAKAQAMKFFRHTLDALVEHPPKP